MEQMLYVGLNKAIQSWLYKQTNKQKNWVRTYLKAKTIQTKGVLIGHPQKTWKNLQYLLCAGSSRRTSDHRWTSWEQHEKFTRARTEQSFSTSIRQRKCF